MRASNLSTLSETVISFSFESVFGSTYRNLASDASTTTICIYKLSPSCFFLNFLQAASLGTQRLTEVSKHCFDFQSRCVSFARLLCRSGGKLANLSDRSVQSRRCALSPRCVQYSIITENPSTPLCPHQYLPLIRPPLPSLPLGRRHLYSAALCLATSAGAAILDRGAHHFIVNKSVSPWALLEWLPCAQQHPLRLGIMHTLGSSPNCVPGGGWGGGGGVGSAALSHQVFGIFFSLFTHHHNHG